MSTDISEEYIAPIFRVQEYAEQETSVKANGRHNFNGVEGFCLLGNKVGVSVESHDVSENICSLASRV
jgi:hypothetical protein